MNDFVCRCNKMTEITYLDRNENQYGPAPACYEALRKTNSESLREYSRDHAMGIKSPLSLRLANEFGIDPIYSYSLPLYPKIESPSTSMHDNSPKEFAFTINGERKANPTNK